jgi:hypothetical protein
VCRRQSPGDEIRRVRADDGRTLLAQVSFFPPPETKSRSEYGPGKPTPEIAAHCFEVL